MNRLMMVAAAALLASVLTGCGESDKPAAAPAAPADTAAPAPAAAPADNAAPANPEQGH